MICNLGILEIYLEEVTFVRKYRHNVFKWKHSRRYYTLIHNIGELYPPPPIYRRHGRGNISIWNYKISFSGQKYINPQLRNDFPCGSAGKESACKAGDLGLIPWLGRFLGEEKGCPLQYSGLENSMDCRGSQSWTWLSDFHFRNENYHFKFFFFFPLKIYYNLKKKIKTNSEQP